MNDVWTKIFSGEVEGSSITLSRYSSGELRVTTTQKYTEANEASSDSSLTYCLLSSPRVT